MTPGKTITLTRQTFVGKVTSLLFNMLSRLVITFLPRSKRLTFTFHFHALEKEMAAHSSVLAWRIPGTGSLVGCCLCGHTESDTTEAT